MKQVWTPRNTGKSSRMPSLIDVVMVVTPTRRSAKMDNTGQQIEARDEQEGDKNGDEHGVEKENAEYYYN